MNAFFIFALGNLLSEAFGIKITKILVPKFVNVGESPKLLCDFDLEGEKLDYVKWYKDGEEIAKIEPNQYPQTQQIRGITLDTKDSNTTRIVLKNVSIFSTGLFKCKVASNKKDVKETAARVMFVIETPKNVELEIPKDVYEIGEMIEAKCISYSSNPVAFISWNINNKDISHPQHESGKTDTDIWHEFLIGIQKRKNDFKGTKSDEFFNGKNSSLQLSFIVQKKSLKDGIKLQCQAHVGDLYVQATRKIQVITSSSNNGNIFGPILYIQIFVLILHFMNYM